MMYLLSQMLELYGHSDERKSLALAVFVTLAAISGLVLLAIGLEQLQQ